MIPNVRWGDERSYFGIDGIEPFAFLGLEQYGVVSVGTYGCVRGDENRFYFKEGLGAMLDKVKPKTVLVYGRMPNELFVPYADSAEFVRYDDWTTIRKRGGQNGHK